MRSSLPLHTEDSFLTFQEAADILNVSKPFIAELISDGRLRVDEATTQDDQRVAKADVIRVRDVMREVADAGLNAISNVGGNDDRKHLTSKWVKTITKK